MAENNTNVNNQAVSAEQAQQIVQQVLGNLLPGLSTVIGDIVGRATGLVPTSEEISNLIPSSQEISNLVPSAEEITNLIPTSEEIANLVPRVSFTNTDGVLNLTINDQELLNLDLGSLTNTTPGAPEPPADTPTE